MTHQFNRLLCSHSTQDVGLYLVTLNDIHTIEETERRQFQNFIYHMTPFISLKKHTGKKHCKNIHIQRKQL